MLKFIEGKAPLVIKKKSVGRAEAGAYFVIKGICCRQHRSYSRISGDTVSYK